MAAHRYWRATHIRSYGSSALELSEFQLLAGSTRVDGPAALASNTAPTTGALADLKDGLTATSVVWTGPAYQGLILTWDFGAGSADVTDIKLGSGLDAKQFLLGALLQWSDDGSTWTSLTPAFGPVAWPGAKSLTTVDSTQSAAILASSPLLYYKLDETSGTTYFDTSGNGRNGTGVGTITQNVAPLARDSSAAITIASNSAGISTADPFGASYAGPWSVRVVVDGLASAGCTVLGRGQDGFGSGWSIAMSVTTTGAISIDTVYSATQRSAVSAAGTHVFGIATEVVATYVGGVLTLYAHGRVVAQLSFAAGGALRDSTVGLTAGRLNGGSSVGTTIDELAWWNIALTPAFIAALANGGRIARAGTVGFRPISAAAARAVSLPPYGAARLAPFVLRGRTDYVTGVLGQGIGRVRGVTLDYVNPLNKPYRCRVRLMREADGLVVREQWSKADGSYDFQYIDELQSYTVVAYYLAHGKRAVITDGLTLANGKVELMA